MTRIVFPKRRLLIRSAPARPLLCAALLFTPRSLALYATKPCPLRREALPFTSRSPALYVAKLSGSFSCSSIIAFQQTGGRCRSGNWIPAFAGMTFGGAQGRLSDTRFRPGRIIERPWRSPALYIAQPCPLRREALPLTPRSPAFYAAQARPLHRVALPITPRSGVEGMSRVSGRFFGRTRNGIFTRCWNSWPAGGTGAATSPSPAAVRCSRPARRTSSAPSTRRNTPSEGIATASGSRTPRRSRPR